MLERKHSNQTNATDSKPQRPAVPRLPIIGIEENPLSKRIRENFDNSNLSFPDDHFYEVYINTNEIGIEDVHEILKDIPMMTEGCHIGFSGWHNFDIMAKRRSGRAIICDINPENALFLHQVLDILRRSENRDNFIEEIVAFIEKYKYSYSCNPDDLELSINFACNVSDDALYLSCDTISDEIAIELKRPSSWLFSQDQYDHIRKLALNDRIALITQNICNSEIFKKLAKLLNDNNIPVDTLYLTNIAYYMKGSNIKLFLQTIETLSASDTILITTEPNKILVQQCNTMKNIREAGLEKFFFKETPKNTNRMFHHKIDKQSSKSGEPKQRCCVS